MTTQAAVSSSHHESSSSSTYRFRVVLWTSGWVMVLSALIAAGTSSTTAPPDGHLLNNAVAQGSLYSSSNWQSKLYKYLLQNLDNGASEVKSNDNHNDDDDNDDNHDFKEDEMTDDDDDTATTTTATALFSKEEFPWHRRLKRNHHTHNNKDREMKARERAKQLHPKKEHDGSLTSETTNHKSKTRTNLQDYEHMSFPSRDAERRYWRAEERFSDLAFREQQDPLAQIQQPDARVPFSPQVPYLGVMVDAGRHYFSIPWLQQFIIYLHRLRFNTIHFRLTDDQAFALQLESYPQLAFPSCAAIPSSSKRPKPSPQEAVIHTEINGKPQVDAQQEALPFQTNPTANSQVYTPEELRYLVAFAKAHDIVIIPEINLPGHAGAWAGIPDLVVNCPEFVCNKGYAIPLNVQHPELKTILKGVIGEVLDIFGDPPFLHLGGNELFLSSPCFHELNRQPFDYGPFEQLLQDVLEDLKYPASQVLRWEATDPEHKHSQQNDNTTLRRTGAIQHYWQTLPTSPDQQQPFFVSTGLNMDANHNNGAEHIYNATVEGMKLQPKGFVVGTSELGVDFFRHRNVMARLIAVAMGATANTSTTTTSSNFWKLYNSTCRETMALSEDVCDLQGYVAVSNSRYQREWKQTWQEWTQNLCNRLTKPVSRFGMPKINANALTTFHEANKHFWRTFKKPLANRTKEFPPLDPQSTTTGVIFDLVNSMVPVNHTIDILKKYIAPLSIRLVQLRLADNHAFSVKLDNLSRVGSSPLANFYNPMPSAQEFASLSQVAGDLGIEVFPEITLSTNAGGWVEGGYMINCPQQFCMLSGSKRVAPNDVGRKEFLPVAYSVVREMMEIFTTTRFLHLGSNERESNWDCFKEEGRYREPPFAAFERNMTHLLQEYLGVPNDDYILRWENQERERYPDRVGAITHYRSTHPFQVPQVRQGEPFFLTIDILIQPTFYDVYKNTRSLLALRPLAIMAEIRNVDQATFYSQSVGLRLISFSLGSRQGQDDYSPDQFQSQLVQECQRVGSELCHMVNTWQPAKNVSYYVDGVQFKHRVCAKHAEFIVNRVARSDIS
ncbi:hexosaminidase subunit beta [Seminavis robusta]|uniref:beta-N-acetylhexosaminidase n=1 Tax=Seminavis robusta TaxID=568900 RepID=A0A9N8HB25_9STRA|nr:hexosaminidase subunit beta [Seminavis robusta]|eukprot:Sro320_g116460.1 hexosaminidase subunit beta (1064) ;mRNA; f:18227-21418